jgi:hypothetical protein
VLFRSGLSAIDPTHWIEPDEDLGRYLDEKERLKAQDFEAVFQAVPGSEAAQRECLDLLTDHLLRDHADLYTASAGQIEFSGRKVAIDDPTLPPLLVAGSLVQDDLAILEKRDNGWVLSAGYVAFPSGWSLQEKAGLPMEGVHAHVPGFEGGTRNATMINRIFDNLQPDIPAARLNWSIYPAGELFWPPERGARSETRPFDPAGNFIRVERQTLRRLPKTGAIVFTIRIYADPLVVLVGRPENRPLAAALADKLEMLTPEQLRYKGMVSKKDALVEYLRRSIA